MKRRPYRARPSTTRRALRWFGTLAVVLLAAYFLGGRLQPGQTRYIYLSPDHYPPGTINPITITLKKGGGLFIVNDAGTYSAVIATDPYDKCRVRWVAAEQAFVSYCSGTKYGVDGRWLEGSAPGGLNRYRVFFDRGNLVVDTEQVIKGSPRPGDAAPANTQ